MSGRRSGRYACSQIYVQISLRNNNGLVIRIRRFRRAAPNPAMIRLRILLNLQVERTHHLFRHKAGTHRAGCFDNLLTAHTGLMFYIHSLLSL